MTLSRRRLPQWAVPLLALAGALALTTLALLTTETSPLAVFRVLTLGAVSTPIQLADMIMLAAPLILCAAGLTLTFNAGLYNLGVEGQVALGAIFTLALVRWLPNAPPPLLWGLAFLAGALGGALWGALAALLRLVFRVSEIFAGLGLNFIAAGLALYLITGPWRKPGTAAITGTELLPDAIHFPTVGTLRLAPVAPIIALVALVVVWFVLARTRWGLTVRATGLNPAAAERFGVPSGRRVLEALGSCGALAGVAGTIQVLGIYHQLIPNISSGIGLIALLVVLLIQYRPVWVLPVAVAFACFLVGAVQLPLALNVDSSIAGVLQGGLVLFALLGRGLTWKR